MAVTKDDFLNLPSTYGIEVGDTVTFRPKNVHEHEHEHEHEAAPAKTGAGALLVSKILTGLIQWGDYTDSDIQKVGNLVAKNLISCTSSQASQLDPVLLQFPGSWATPLRKIDAMLRGLLENEVPRSRHVHVNSNEPVLLINFEGVVNDTTRRMMEYISSMTVTNLQRKWNIWPVRVYAGSFLPSTNQNESNEEEAADHFSITLLNVVNSDIGGPSMLQLLDMPCDATRWNKCFRKEVWQDREMLSAPAHVRAEYEAENKTGGDDTSEHSVMSADDNESVGSDVSSLAILRNPEQRISDSPEPGAEQMPAGEQEAENQGLPASPSGNVARLLSKPGESTAIETSVEEPDVAEGATQVQSSPRELDISDKVIEHPSWQRHDDSTSLLDLIRSQVSLMAPFGSGGAGHGVPDLEGNEEERREIESEPPSSFKDVGHAPNEPGQRQSKSLEDDEFVVV